MDALLVGVLILAAVGVAVYRSPASSLNPLVLLVSVPYLLGRLAGVTIPNRTRTYLRCVFLGLAAWAVVEFAFDWHPFVGVRGSLRALVPWEAIQYRGAYARSEAAFGHSIGLGAVIAMGAPFVIRRGGRSTLPSLVLITLGVAATLSRGAFLGLGVALLLSFWAEGISRGRLVALLATGSAIVVLAGPIFGGIDAEAGRNVDSSAAYRIRLYEQSVGSIGWIGLSPTTGFSSAEGRNAYGAFVSIDNAYLRIGLDFGWVTLIVFLLLFAIPAVRVIFRRTRDPGEIALVAMAAVLMTVAPITQWTAFMGMVGGLAVSAAAQPVLYRPSGAPRLGHPATTREGTSERTVVGVR